MKDGDILEGAVLYSRDSSQMDATIRKKA